MTITRAQIIIFISIILIVIGIYLINKDKNGSEGNSNTKWGKILTWIGAIALVVTSASSYKIVPRY